MEQRHVENISALIHFMNGLHDAGFDMGKYINWCGTPSCALGWACKVPALEAQGLDFKKLKDGGSEIVVMAENVFGEYLALFASNLRKHIATPQDWANHAQAYLLKHGHEVASASEAQRDEFRSFMERVMKPVAITA